MKPSRNIRLLRLFTRIIFPFIIAIGLLTSVACRPAATQIENPYAGIDWKMDNTRQTSIPIRP
jgi:hypothetical protein